MPSAAEVFDEFAALTAGTPVRYSGVTHARLRAEGPLQWPCPAPDHPGTERLYTDGRFPTADGRARFVRSSTPSPAEPCDADFPLTLTTGRVRNHWHTLTRTGKSPALLRAHARALRRGQPAGRTPRGGARWRLRGGHLAARQGGGPGARHRVHPRGHLLPALPLGPPLRLLQGRPTTSRCPPATRSRTQPELKAARCASGSLPRRRGR